MLCLTPSSAPGSALLTPLPSPVQVYFMQTDNLLSRLAIAKDKVINTAVDLCVKPSVH